MTMQGADQLLNDLEISPASSNLFVLSSIKFCYFSGIVYCLTNTGLPSVTCTSKVCRLVHPTSVEDFDMILANCDSSMFILWISIYLHPWHLQDLPLVFSLWFLFPCYCQLGILAAVLVIPSPSLKLSAKLFCNFSFF